MAQAGENISQVVAILTAINTGQEDMVEQLIAESDTVELFSAVAGLLLGTLKKIAKNNNSTVEDYLIDLGMFASKCSS